MSAGPNPPASPSGADEMSLGELLAVLWAGRWIILGCALPTLLLAGLYLWRATPIYQVDAMLFVDPKQASKGGPALAGRVENLFEVNSQAMAEVEILQSNQVLGRAVEMLRLDLVAGPKSKRAAGKGGGRGGANAPAIEVETFELPEGARGEEFSIEAEGNGAYSWKDGNDQVLARGRVGEEVQASWQGQPMKLKLRTFSGRSGEVFTLKRKHILEAIEDLRRSMTVGEKGKETNILLLTYEDPNPVCAAEVLNTVLDQYIRDNIDRKTQEASRTLSFIQEQMASLRDKQLKAEQQLNQSRAGARSADLGEEARLVLQRSVDLEKEILAQRQKREELLRTYKEQSDVVITLDQQIAKLQEEGRRLDTQVKSLPRTQQEVVRHSRDVQVNQEQYSSLMNLEAINLQQLQMAKAGDIGNARIVDRARPTLQPVKPQKRTVLGLGLLLGVMAGAGLVLLRRAFRRRGVEDPQLLETQFGLPVLATIPHSENQEIITRQFHKLGEQIDLLSTAHSDDLAVESLRSLRTSLHFSLVDAPNRAIMIAGSAPEIGKSFVSVNFAVVLAQYGARVLLVDADMRKGKLHRHFGAMARKDGLSEILAGRLAWQDALHHAHGLDMISTGTLPPNPSELLSGKRFQAFMAEVSSSYDFIIIDVPPVLAVTDAAIVGANVGAVVLVVKDGYHPLGEIRAALQCLEMAGIRAKGFVFNDMDMQNARFGYHRYAYHYSYKR